MYSSPSPFFFAMCALHCALLTAHCPPRLSDARASRGRGMDGSGPAATESPHRVRPRETDITQRRLARTAVLTPSPGRERSPPGPWCVPFDSSAGRWSAGCACTCSPARPPGILSSETPRFESPLPPMAMAAYCYGSPGRRVGRGDEAPSPSGSTAEAGSSTKQACCPSSPQCCALSAIWRAYDPPAKGADHAACHAAGSLPRTHTPFELTARPRLRLRPPCHNARPAGRRGDPSAGASSSLSREPCHEPLQLSGFCHLCSASASGQYLDTIIGRGRVAAESARTVVALRLP